MDSGLCPGPTQRKRSGHVAKRPVACVLNGAFAQLFKAHPAIPSHFTNVPVVVPWLKTLAKVY